jgi:hypothetical protein
MEKLLARIKALFEPNRPAEPSPEVEAAPPTPAVAPTPEARPPEPVATVLEAPPAPVTPATEEEVPAPAAEAPSVADEAPVEAEPTPPVAEVEPTAAVAPGVLALRWENERGSRSTFEVTKAGATIGRGPESTIQLADLSVSRKHAKIAYRQNAYWLSDLGSMGGTWVDGTKLAAPRRVATGQTIDIGVCRLTVVSSGVDEEPSAAKPTSHAASRR